MSAQLVIERKIAVVKPTSVRAWQKSPSDQTAAVGAAATSAKKQNKPMIVVVGNSYGSTVFHIIDAADALRGIHRWNGGFNRDTPVLFVEPDGSVSKGIVQVGQ
jgi:hypothetical protein